MAWMTFFAFLVVASLLFAVANKQSVAQSATLMTRLFLQLGYQLTLRRREETFQCCLENLILDLNRRIHKTRVCNG